MSKALLPILLSGLTGLVPAQDKPAEKAEPERKPIPWSKAATESLVARYKSADHWLQKAVILLTLQEWWSPEGAEMLRQAFEDKDRRMAAFALEALHRADKTLLPMVVDAELLGELIDKQLDRKNQHYRKRLLEALALIAPEAKAEKKSDWEKWWRKAKKEYTPKASAWKPRPIPEEQKQGGTVTAVDRAFDLYQHGLDMVLCVDSTGSMQPTIDAIKDGLDQMVDLVDGLSPKYRLGVVHYKDEGNMGEVSAAMVQPLTKGLKRARKELSKLRAGGGNASLPEHMLDGVKVSFDPKMRWDPDANKVLVLVGDAPCLEGQLGPIVELLKQARNDPAKLNVTGRPTTGKPKSEFRPYVTACIGVFVEYSERLMKEIRADHAKNKTTDALENNLRRWEASKARVRKEYPELAEAGGGTYQVLTFTARHESEQPKKPQRRRRAPAEVPEAIQNVVAHILVLSFGKEYAPQMRDFAGIYFRYKADKLFR